MTADIGRGPEIKLQHRIDKGTGAPKVVDYLLDRIFQHGIETLLAGEAGDDVGIGLVARSEPGIARRTGGVTAERAVFMTIGEEEGAISVVIPASPMQAIYSESCDEARREAGHGGGAVPARQIIGVAGLQRLVSTDRVVFPDQWIARSAVRRAADDAAIVGPVEADTRILRIQGEADSIEVIQLGGHEQFAGFEDQTAIENSGTRRILEVEYARHTLRVSTGESAFELPGEGS